MSKPGELMHFKKPSRVSDLTDPSEFHPTRPDPEIVYVVTPTDSGLCCHPSPRNEVLPM